MDRVLAFVIGSIFVGGGVIFIKNSLEAKNLIESALFGAFSMGIGLFLVIGAIVGFSE